MTHIKASDLLSLPGSTSKDGLGIRPRGLWFQGFKNPKKKDKWANRIEKFEAYQLHTQIPKIILKEIPEDEEGTLELPGDFVQMSNDLAHCRWLVKAGDTKLKFFVTRLKKTPNSMWSKCANSPITAPFFRIKSSG
jgi:hypothetical protein